LTPILRIVVHPAAPDELAEPLSLLEEALRNGEPVPRPFAERFRRAVEGGNLEVLAARAGPKAELVGVAMLAFRLSICAGAAFCSVEDFYVKPDARRRGVGRALIEAVGERCRARGVSYVEVQTDGEAAPFYRASGYETEPGVRVLSRSYAF
jgi:GNAT superfamily N-acetyltransferase